MTFTEADVNITMVTSSDNGITVFFYVTPPPGSPTSIQVINWEGVRDAIVMNEVVLETFLGFSVSY